MNFHCLSSFNPETKEAICSVCGPTKTVSRGEGKRVCVAKHKEYRRKWEKTPGGKAYKRRHNGTKHREHVGMVCERCGYEALDIIEMDGHHKDWNHDNNDPANIETLCAICHRLVHRGLEKLIEARKGNLGILTPTEPQKAVESKEAAKAEVLALLENNDQLTRDVNRLMDEVESLKMADSDNPQIASLLAENLKLKAKVKEYEQTYG
jgi:hypothetical protein